MDVDRIKMQATLDQLVRERLKYSSETFRQRVIATLCTKYGACRWGDVVDTTVRLSRVNISIAACMRNPFRRPESGFIAAALLMIVPTALTAALSDMASYALVLLSSAVVLPAHLVRRVSASVIDAELELATYSEIITIVTSTTV